MSEFLNMDCIEGMKQFPDKYFDLAIVDPPYGINANKFGMGDYKKKTGKNSAAVESRRAMKGRLSQGAGKLKNRTLQKMQCDWDYSPPSEEYFAELFRVSKNQVIWGGELLPFTAYKVRCSLG